MSQFFDLASLVAIPSGYKTSIIYAQKPLSTSGQLAFVRNTTATRVSESGVISPMGSNVPRLDYLNSSCPRFLFEPQRTNLVTYSEDFLTPFWTKADISISSDVTTAPDGNGTGALYSAEGVVNYLGGSATSSGNNTVTYSIFAKADSVSEFRITEASYYESTSVFNLANGTVISGSGTITSYGDGWYRCTHTQAYGAGETNLIWQYDLNGAQSGTAFIFGAQAEAGTWATSYIPTSGATVTRNAETCSKTGISSLIGQAQGTLFAEFSVPVNEAVTRAIVLSGSTVSNRVVISVTGALVSAVVDVAGSSQVNATAAINPTAMNKVALRYKANDFALYLNGTKVITDTTGSTFSGSTLDRIAFAQPNGTSPFSGKVAKLLVSQTAFTDTQLAQLTTL